jgi:hypothetical protein
MIRAGLITTLAVLIAGLSLAGNAAASGNHWCRQSPAWSGPGSGWPILAAATVSCPFAGKVHDAYADHGQMPFFRGRVRSPVTHQSYLVTCRGPRSGPSYVNGHVTCTGVQGIWLRFGPLYN